MDFAYRSPGAISFTLSGTGASFLSDIRLASGQPAEETLIQWLSADPVALTDFVEIRGDWSAGLRLRLVGALGLSCPVGTLVELRGLVTNWAGSVLLGAQKRTRRLPDGSVGAWWVLPPDTSIVAGAAVRVYNDENGSTWADDETELRVGELVMLGGATLSAKLGYKRVRKSMSDRTRTLAGGVLEVSRPSYVTKTFTLNDTDLDEVRNNGLDNGEDWEMLEAALWAPNARCAAVVCADSEAEIHRTAIYGIGEVTEISHAGGRYYSAALSIEEIPPDQSSTT